MTLWNNCTMTTLYYSADASHDWVCVVKIDDKKILVEYQYEGDALVQYTGKDQGNGHFELTANKVFGKASLHMFPGADLLVGNWHEGGTRGMWQIQLA